MRLVEVLDLAAVWLLVWAGIAWVRGTPARGALVGLGILLGVYLVARQLGLVLTTWLMQGFAAVGALIAVVVFQQDLRRLFEQIASVWFRRSLPTSGPDMIDKIVRAVAYLAEHRQGALIVFPGREPLEGHIDGGLVLDAHISEPLLLSLFDPSSAGHDGAVIVEGNRISRFAAHLPLSTNHEQLGQRGTRHAAGLGLSERTDALCVIVSEERGTVSVAESGELRTLTTPHRAADEVRAFEQRLAPVGGEGRRRFRFLQRWREGLLAIPVAATMWLLAVPGATEVQIERVVPISLRSLPPAYELETMEPETVRVVISGPRRAVYFLSTDALRVRLDALLVELGRRTFPLTAANVSHPEDVEIVSITPDTVKLSLREKPAGAAR